MTSAPRDAVAQQFSFQNYCTTGSLQLCSSVEFSLIPLAGGTLTQLQIRVRNLQGTLGGTTPFGLGSVVLSGLTTDLNGLSVGLTTSPNLTGTASRVCNTSGLPFACGGQQEWWGIGLGGTGSLGRIIEGTPPWDYPLVGCDLPTLPGGSGGVWGVDGYIQTCGDGWAEVNVTFAGAWEFTNSSTVTLTGFSDAGDFSCEIGTTCVQVQATPEPVTIVLLGSGLTGLAAIRSRRRKQDDAV